MENSKQLEELRNSLGSLLDINEDQKNLIDQIIKLIALPDPQFEVLAPNVLQTYQQMLNNPNEKLALAQSVNAYGGTAEDLIESFQEFEEEVDKLDMPKIKRDFFKQILGATVTAVNETEGIAKRMIPVAIELCHPNAKMPQYAHISDSGMDVFAIEDFTVKPGETKLIPTGLKFALPPGFEFQVRAKSGRALKTKLRLANAIGTIDQAYRQELKIIIENVEPPIRNITYELDDSGRPVITSIEHGRDFTIGAGEKICQLVLAEVPKATFYEVKNVQEIGEDRGGGFGSTSIYAKEDSRYGTDIT